MRDVLSDVLAVTRLGATVLAQAELVAPFGLAVDPMSEAAIHIVQRGACWLRMQGERRPIQLSQGDLVMVCGSGHAVTDSPNTPVLPYADVLRAMPRRLEKLPLQRRDETTVILCGKYLFEHRGPHPLLSLLPALIHLRAYETERHPQLPPLLSLLRMEAMQRGSGSELVVPRLMDTLLIFVVRAWLDAQPVGAGGWFGALRDPAIARALSLIHETPSEPWQVESLAKQVGQSRATFARRFHELVGEPPLSYVTRWRMCLVAKLLNESDRSLEEIASSIGYESAAALSKAFKRQYGIAPAHFREQGRAAPATARAG
jgi:AraC-like DNA-binding protein